MDPVTILGLISSIISIVEASKKVYDIAKSKEGIPEAFVKAAQSLSLVENTLEHVESRLSQRPQTCTLANREEDECIREVLKGCESKAVALKTIFDKALPKDGEWIRSRYWRAVKTIGLGKPGKVENLMKDILTDVQTITNNHTIQAATSDQVELLHRTIEELDNIEEPSMPDEQFDQCFLSQTHSGSGNNNVLSGSGTLNNVSRNQYNATTQHFGKD